MWRILSRSGTIFSGTGAWYDRWRLVAPLSERVRVERFRQTPPVSEPGERDIGVSGIGTVAVATVAPRDSPENAFIAVSMYARWMKPHPSSAHRILSDLSAFIGRRDPSRQRIPAACDLNMCYGAQGGAL